jgi:hypothetical protein
MTTRTFASPFEALLVLSTTLSTSALRFVSVSFQFRCLFRVQLVWLPTFVAAATLPIAPAFFRRAAFQMSILNKAGDLNAELLRSGTRIIYVPCARLPVSLMYSSLCTLSLWISKGPPPLYCRLTPYPPMTPRCLRDGEWQKTMLV